MRVLVVDDHADTRELLARNLERASYGVKAVASCAEEEAVLALGPFDVLVLDVMLPDGSGIDLCERLRARKTPVPILLLTARGEVRDRVAGLDAGADDYLVKPFAVLELLARVKALARRGPLTRDRALAFGHGGAASAIPLRDASKAKDDGRLPMTDHNTRIFVVGDGGTQARAVAEAITRDAFHNVSFFDGRAEELSALMR